MPAMTAAELNHEYWLLDADIPYREKRLEFVKSGFLPPDANFPFPCVLRLTLEETVTEKARRLENATAEVNATKQGDFITSDMAILACTEQIGKILHERKR